jgi:thiol:disulfide interchange protein DsbD
MGALSALIVSPCVSAPLVGALLYLSSTGDAVLGGLALLSLGLGMGVPLLAVGVGGAGLLPRAGAWMDRVKAVFGFLLLGVAVWLLERLLPGPLTLLLWAALAIGAGVFLGVFDRREDRGGFARLAQAAGVLLLVWGVLLSVGAASGASDPLRPLGRLAEARAAGEPGAASGHAAFVDVRGMPQVRAAIAAAAQAGKPVLLDLYADWCIACKVMERDVFPVAEVQASMSRFTLLRVDVTANDELDREVLAEYGLFGPPSMLFFDATGRERTEFRVQGERDAAEFAAHLQRVLAGT